jgi:hypothetical protein
MRSDAAPMLHPIGRALAALLKGSEIKIVRVDARRMNSCLVCV